MSFLTFPIRVPGDMLEALGKHTGHFWSDSLALEPHIWEAIENYINPAPAAQAQPAEPTDAGYQWKQVFLPEGTKLRAAFGRKQYFAVVQGAEIKYEKRSLSPSSFANLRGSGNRNAWKAIWLRFPGSDAWLLADVCRSASKAAIARLFGVDAPGGKAQADIQLSRPLQKMPTLAPTLLSDPRRSESRPSGAPAAASGNAERSNKSGAGRGRRRKRRTKKHVSGKP